jgi:flagellar protein FlgJ
MIAQSAIETGWGSSVKSFAYFGIKGKSQSGNSTSFVTHEVVGGKSVQITDSFRAYLSIDEAADDYGSFLKNNPRYAGCFGYSNDPDSFAATLANAGYATDPLYLNKILSIMRTYDLEHYDK